ncbi:hypothetical protein M3Y96_00441800 [Aphelenchoides besseyi]|nr:hypothetical protein M3Y96_00441800 [Aphelenchoides besseyi]
MLISRELNLNIKKLICIKFAFNAKFWGLVVFEFHSLWWSARLLEAKDATSHQYIVQKQLGSGSFGDVYCVERKRDRLRMAVKIE